MWESIGMICLVAFTGALSVPVVLLTLARLGLFEPIEINAFGKTWRFAPQ